MKENILNGIENIKTEMTVLETLSRDLDFRPELNNMIDDIDYNFDYYDNDMLCDLDSSMGRFFGQIKVINDLVEELEAIVTKE